MRSEVFIEPTTPAYIGTNFESDVQEYNYGQIAKSLVHIFIIPFMLSFIDPKYPLAYVAVVSALYATVFRDRASEYFGVLSLVIALAALFVVAF